ncbi:hypothetical protein OH76DRAFT_538969 [Lentinus brumalis]|uniref:F-box domain-containing protein n=1 Tax=Lentinus brumalis TaxID=2498619 RepID=A0A371CHJ8_9APHY|nr:hypothetical protein OH76DRAFT_538969 [Polyporus brumalis]
MFRLTVSGALDNVAVDTYINGLPAEVLVAIFKFTLATEARDPSFQLVGREGQRVETSQLLELTHVCRRWRIVAVGQARLWTHCDDRHLEQLETFARRSKMVPLSLFLTHNLTSMRGILHSYATRPV